MDFMLSSHKTQLYDSMTCMPVWYGFGNMDFIIFILFPHNNKQTNKQTNKQKNQNETKGPMDGDKDDCILCVVNAY